MNPIRSEGNWKQVADSVRRYVGKLIEGQRDLWSGKRDRAKSLAHEPVQPHDVAPPK
jgi:uncharacterized protein YjbJ (UPF0337 family)